MPPDSPNSYDVTPYASYPYPASHPGRMAAIGQLLGLDPPPPRTARILELGCASGGNIIPIAADWPQTDCLGIDLSTVQIQAGVETIAALRLDNVDLRAISLGELDGSWGRFDYIICHGVYSWVEPALRERILDICHECLAVNGIAYISYNTQPGWRMKGTVRDLMRAFQPASGSPADRIARARELLEFLADATPEAIDPYSLFVRAELAAIRDLPDTYILHEYLEEENVAFYFPDFVADARRHGLQYLAETDLRMMLASNFPAEVAGRLNSLADDLVHQELLMDFLRNRTFRQSLLVHEQQPINRQINAQRIAGLWVASRATPETPEPDLRDGVSATFHMANGASITTPDAATKAALWHLGQIWPALVGVDELVEIAARLSQAPVDAAELRSDLLHCYAAGCVELHGVPGNFVTHISERPVASPLARRQARDSGLVTNRRHETARLAEPERQILTQLDGSRSLAELGALNQATDVVKALETIAALALLTG